MTAIHSPIASMTGFAATSGSAMSSGIAWNWAWEIRSVNARGLDVRFRLPHGLDAQESAWRGLAAAQLRRGTVSATLRLGQAEQARATIDRAWLSSLADAADAMAAARPGTPRPRIELLMALPGVLRRDAGEAETAAGPEVIAAAAAGFAEALGQLIASRQAEGQRLRDIIAALLRQLDALHQEAAGHAAAQGAAQRALLGAQMRALLGEHPALPEDRLAQELALLAARADVTEELDRLASHIAAAHELLSQGGPQGRQLDFLVQEFMREANTLCAKSASIALTGTGLQMKAAIEQIREQVQNIE